IPMLDQGQIRGAVVVPANRPGVSRGGRGHAKEIVVAGSMAWTALESPGLAVPVQDPGVIEVAAVRPDGPGVARGDRRHAAQGGVGALVQALLHLPGL